MTVLARRRAPARTALLDKWLEAVPVFRLSDSAEDGALAFIGDDQTRWRVLPAPGERLPGTFDQDVYIELMHRFQDAGEPTDGALTFTLHAFLRSMGRQAKSPTHLTHQKFGSCVPISTLYVTVQCYGRVAFGKQKHREKSIRRFIGVLYKSMRF